MTPAQAGRGRPPAANHQPLTTSRYCEDFPCCGHEAGDCDGSLYGSDEAIKRRVYERGYDEMEDEEW